MERVCCIIDMEGFRVDGKFLVREIGWIRISDMQAGSVRFDLRSHPLSEAGKFDVEYVTKNISGLPYDPMPYEETFPLHCLDIKIREIYAVCKSPNKDTVAFKGGQQEKAILQSLGIPWLNLEDYGCPKYEAIKDSGTVTCGYHINQGHCPLDEVKVFRSWMVTRIRLLNHLI